MIPTQSRIDAALADLKGDAATLAGGERVRFMAYGDPDMPAEAIRAHAGSLPGRFGPGMPSLTWKDDDDFVTVILGNLSHLPREIIALAMIQASPDAGRDGFSAVAEEGRTLVAHARDRVKSRMASVSDHRDLKWCANPSGWSQGAEAGHFARLSAFMDLYPTTATLALGQGLGLRDREAVDAAVFAHYLVQNGFTDAQAPAARATVAYRHQGNPGALAALFEDAVLTSQPERGLRP